jgi:PAS domain S-box-containing protein
MSKAIPPSEESKQAESLLASPEFARAFENQEFRQILEHIPFALLVAEAQDGKPRILYVNEYFADLSGRPLEQTVGLELAALDYFLTENEPSRTLGAAIAEGEDYLGVFWTQRGEQRIVAEAYVSRIDSDGGNAYQIAALIDITDRDRAAHEEANKALANKDMLMRELQHRVRNNLQLIIALIRLEARQLKRGEPVELDRLAHRVHALSLLYAALSPDSSDADIDFTQYIHQIAGAIMESNAPENVRLDLKLENSVVPVNTALSVGLVVNELITNAFKYAFAGRAEGRITVRCMRNGAECLVSVEDDGVGLPEGTTWPVRGKIGELMVRSLVENTKAQFEVVSRPGAGTQVTMRFLVRPASA